MQNMITTQFEESNEIYFEIFDSMRQIVYLDAS